MKRIATRCAWACFALATLTGCGAGCPSAESPAKSRQEWADKLARRLRLVAVPEHRITVKRDVHSFVLAADADQVARAFHAVMRIPHVRFGMIEVDRPDADEGQPFHLGSRFQGRYRLEAGSPLLADLSKWSPARAAFCSFENSSTSDYGVIAALVLPSETPRVGDPPHPAVGTTYVLEYTYLIGSPIGGSSRFEVLQLADNRSQLTQIFQYQEVNASFAAFFANGGLTLHEQVVSSQVAKTAARLNVEIISTDMPKAYLMK